MIPGTISSYRLVIRVFLPLAWDSLLTAQNTETRYPSHVQKDVNKHILQSPPAQLNRSTTGGLNQQALASWSHDLLTLSGQGPLLMPPLTTRSIR
jgi:hypothetical protein